MANYLEKDTNKNTLAKQNKLPFVFWSLYKFRDLLGRRKLPWAVIISNTRTPKDGIGAP